MYQIIAENKAVAEFEKFEDAEKCAIDYSKKIDGYVTIERFSKMFGMGVYGEYYKGDKKER